MQYKYAFLPYIILFLLLHIPSTMIAAQNGGATNGNGTTHEETLKAAEEPAVSIIQFYTWAGILPKDLVDLQTRIKTIEYLEKLEKDLPPVATEIAELQQDVSEFKTSDNLQIMQVDSFQTRLNRIKYQISKSSKPLNETISKLSLWRTDWKNKQDQLAEFSKLENLSLALENEQKQDLTKTIETALKHIEQNLSPSLVLGRAIADLQVQLHTIESDLQTIETTIRKTSTQQTSPSVLSLAFYKQINGELFLQTFQNSTLFFNQHLESLVKHARIAAFSVLVLVALIILVKLSQRHITTISRWYPFASCPLSTSVFILTTFYDLISQQFFSIKLDYKWDEILSVLTLLAVIRLIKHCIENPQGQQILRRLAMFMAMTLMFVAIDLPLLIILFFVVYASVAALFIYVYQLRFKYRNNLERWTRRSWGIFPLMIIISGVMGYDQFAIYSFTILLETVSSCLVVWMLYRLNSAILELCLKAIPFSLLKDNRHVVVKSLQPFIAWIHWILLISLLGVVWNFFPSIDAAISAINSFGFKLGDFNISPGFVLTIIFVLYGATLFSKAIQAILLKEILPRYSAEKGVQLSITRLVHYAIVTVGFFIMLKALGFELKQITLLGGALGVGIGFGLQAIVTNFAGGLILLFERPLKVGDTIQIGTDLGEVKHLGLRATIIQTFDNAEIVIPNSDLITGQVTNWTLAERRVRVKIPVGVAYGSDVSKVLEILQTCGNQNPMVLSTPKPNALFLAFGASSLDFELRVWIPEFLDSLTVKSDLNQSIESEFDFNNIEIPFLQTDLHIRSIDEKAATALSGGGVESKTTETS
ncbi:mechanosensitive ion channel domain-containing protein [Desulfosediminicola flagellatus]|uniref:mechanosensitive ion channel domain-containing protein n=1 Tax=Desulfosediminicola flagellatus TaxID=2569541 RepID=UPI0010ACC63A|nr:mechanosensitive ion channel domain-containing protein [Desulfosediminicola flagellatus]